MSDNALLTVFLVVLILTIGVCHLYSTRLNIRFEEERTERERILAVSEREMHATVHQVLREVSELAPRAGTKAEWKQGYSQALTDVKHELYLMLSERMNDD